MLRNRGQEILCCLVAEEEMDQKVVDMFEEMEQVWTSASDWM